MPKLKNQRWERFAQELFKGHSAGEAYTLVGYKPNRGNATRLKANEAIKDRVAELQNSFEEKAIIDKNRVLEEFGKIAFSKITDFLEWNSSQIKLRPSEEISEESKAVIADIRGSQSGLSVRLHSKIRALEMLGKHLGFFRDQGQLHIEMDSGEEALNELLRQCEDFNQIMGNEGGHEKAE